MTPPSRTKRRLLGLARLAAVLIGAGVFAALFTRSLQDNDSLASISSGIATIITLFLGLFDHLRRQDPIPPLDDAAEDLRLRLLDECDTELHRRVQRIPHEKIIPLEWKKYRGTGPSPLDGRFEGDPEEAATRLAERFDQPSGKKRMVVLGEPGAGKTFIALSLTVGLLRRWTRDKPIAVYLSLSTLDPVVDEDLDDWIVDTIAKSYYLGEQRTPRALLLDRRLLPVLDGLDELPEHLRRLAVQRINESLTGDRMLVITCRTAEYEDVLTGGAPALLHAPVVEVRPVAFTDLRARLKAVPAWKDIAQRVEAHPNNPLTTALSTPLMLSLFAAGYLDKDPAALLDETKFANTHAVERHLVDLKLDTAYPERAPRGQWNAVQARKWLTFLAQHMHDHDERDLTWRKLAYRALTTSTAMVTAAAVGVGLLWRGTLHVYSTNLSLLDRPVEPVHATSTLFDSPSLTALILGALAAAVWLASRRLKTSKEAVQNSRLSGFRRGATVGFTVVVAPGSFLILISEGFATYDQAVNSSALVTEVLALAVVCAAAIGLHEMIVERTTARLTARSAWDGLKQERASTLAAAVTAGLVVGTLSIPVMVMSASLGSHLGQRLATSLGLPAVADLGLAPLLTYSDWRFSPDEVERLVNASILIALLFAVMLATTRAWTRLLMVRIWLASTGRLPWRLQRFLADATERGLLRRAGMGHQFGHALLQDRLVSPDATRKPERLRTRARVAVAVAAAALLLTVGGAVWSGSPASCRETQWSRINSQMTRATIGPDSACFATLDQGDQAPLQRDESDRPMLTSIMTPRPQSDERRYVRNEKSLLVVGEFDRFSASEWHDILVGLAAAKQVSERVDEVHFVFSDLEKSAGPEAAKLVQLYLAWAGDRSSYNFDLTRYSAVALDVASSLNGRRPTHVVGMEDLSLLSHAKEHATLEANDLLIRSDRTTKIAADALVDGVNADECATLKKERFFSVGFDLRNAQLTSALLNDISACHVDNILVRQEDVMRLTSMQRPNELRIFYVDNQSTTIEPSCARSLGPNPSSDSIKACVALVAVAESYRVAVKEMPEPS